MFFSVKTFWNKCQSRLTTILAMTSEKTDNIIIYVTYLIYFLYKQHSVESNLNLKNCADDSLNIHHQKSINLNVIDEIYFIFLKQFSKPVKIVEYRLCLEIITYN